MALVDNWARLGEAVTRRRGFLGHPTRQQFADATGFPAKTLSDLEKHRRENFDASTFGRLERALKWPPGAINAILAGAPVPGDMPTGDLDQPPPMFSGALTPGAQVDAWLHPTSDLPERDRVALRQLVTAAIHLAEQAAIAAAKERGWPDVPAPEKARDAVR